MGLHRPWLIVMVLYCFQYTKKAWKFPPKLLKCVSCKVHCRFPPFLDHFLLANIIEAQFLILVHNKAKLIILEQQFQYCCFRNFRCFSKRKHCCIFFITCQDVGFMQWHLKSLKFMYSLGTYLSLVTSHQSKYVELVLSTLLDAILPEKGRKIRFTRFGGWIFTLSDELRSDKDIF